MWVNGRRVVKKQATGRQKVQKVFEKSSSIKTMAK